MTITAAEALELVSAASTSAGLEIDPVVYEDADHYRVRVGTSSDLAGEDAVMDEDFLRNLTMDAPLDLVEKATGRHVHLRGKAAWDYPVEEMRPVS